MNEKIQKTFDDITAPESLKLRTARYIAEKRQSRKQISFFKPVYALAAAALLLIVFAGYGMYFTPRSVISVDINPSVEMEVNMFDRVISVKGYNEDGQQLADSVDVVHKDYYSALNSLINSEIIQNCLADRQELTVTLACDNPEKSRQMGERINSCTGRVENSYFYTCSYDRVQSAHNMGFSCGKYQAYLRLREVYPDITPQQAAEMTMKEIHRMTDYYCNGIGQSSDRGQHGQHHGQQ